MDHQHETQDTKLQQQRAVLTSNLRACGERLQNGELVAFPTETVYGLGCNALDPSAIRKVFAAKKRPYSDPLIAHVLHLEDALKLWNTNDDPSLTRLLTQLGTAFWPGPLTLVAAAAAHVPSILMADTGSCAVRSPRHPVARTLIQHAACPVAAPSANTFGHVSPTSAQHVYDDLAGENVWILVDDDVTTDDDTTTTTTCDVGVESTVVHVQPDGLTILRQGAISAAALAATVSVPVHTKKSDSKSKAAATIAPGQTVQHYAPRVPSCMVTDDCPASRDDNDSGVLVVMDVNGRLAARGWTTAQNAAIVYRNLGPDAAAAAQTVFATLRWAESVPQARLIVFPAVIAFEDGDSDTSGLVGALRDRLNRAASGVIVSNLKEASLRSRAVEE